MKCPTLLVAVLLSASYAVASANLGIRAADDAPDGFYTHMLDEAGNENVTFVPYEEVAKRSNTEAFREYTERSRESGRSRIEARRNACGPGTAEINDILNTEYFFAQEIGDQLNSAQNVWHYFIRNTVIYFVCPYSAGYKRKDAIQATWQSVSDDCGVLTMGYNQVSGGMGDWTTGRCVRSDHFCTKTFRPTTRNEPTAAIKL